MLSQCIRRRDVVQLLCAGLYLLTLPCNCLEMLGLLLYFTGNWKMNAKWDMCHYCL